MKPFDLEAAKNGAPVCTRDGRKARILCFDLKDTDPIVAAIEDENGIETVATFSIDGLLVSPVEEQSDDLFMKPQTCEAFVNVYRLSKNGTFVTGRSLHRDFEEAKRNRFSTNLMYVRTAKITWED